MKRKYIYLILLFYSIFIFAVSSFPGSNLQETKFDLMDKIFHIGAYGILAVIGVNCIKRDDLIGILLIMIVGTIYGGLIEIWQGTVVERDANIYDGVANSIGMVLGSIIGNKYFYLVND